MDSGKLDPGIAGSGGITGSGELAGRDLAVENRCNRLRCPLARMSGLQCLNMGHNGHRINLYGVSMTPMGN